VGYRFASGKNERLFELAADLVGAGVDLIVTEGTPSTLAAMRAATLAAMRATRTIPIVFGSAQDPVEKGIVASLAYPSGNVTGSVSRTTLSRSNCSSRRFRESRGWRLSMIQPRAPAPTGRRS